MEYKISFLSKSKTLTGSNAKVELVLYANESPNKICTVVKAYLYFDKRRVSFEHLNTKNCFYGTKLEFLRENFGGGDTHKMLIDYLINRIIEEDIFNGKIKSKRDFKINIVK